MTGLMSQVTCSLCNIKTDELQWNKHIISTDHLNRCKNIKHKIAIKFFEMIFSACLKKSKIYNLENEKTHNFWQLYFSTKLPKEKFNIIYSDSINNSALETNLSSDFRDFIQNVAPDIGEEYFDTMDKIMFCKICSIEINKSLLYDHINSKEHKDIENYFIMKCMTRCEVCNKEIKNDEWREHIASDKHLEIEQKHYCKLCDMKTNPRFESSNQFHKKFFDMGYGSGHVNSPIHIENQKRSGFYVN